MVAIAENAGGELMQDSVSQTLAIEMLDGTWQAGDSLTLEDMQSRFGISRMLQRHGTEGRPACEKIRFAEPNVFHTLSV